MELQKYPALGFGDYGLRITDYGLRITDYGCNLDEAIKGKNAKAIINPPWHFCFLRII